MCAQPTHHCRLYVIPAREAPVALILRRGPTKWYHIMRWHMDSDAFEHGAWFRGRIYENRCDISPDGKLMIYMCSRGTPRPGYGFEWTALSRAPWLYALTLWPWMDTMGGGGRFLSNDHLALHAGCPIDTHPDHPLQGIDVTYGGEDYHPDFGAASWSGHDHLGNVIFCREGKLFRHVDGKDHEIVDLNGLRPNPQPAPDWAKQPLIDAQDGIGGPEAREDPGAPENLQ